MGPDSLNTSTVPSSVPASAPASAGTQSADLASIIQNIVKPLDVQQALTPIAGSHTAAMPSAYTTPIGPYQNAPLDTRPVVGAGNARARGIGNSIVGAMNVLGNIVTAEAQKKQGQIRDAAQTVITSQQAIDEAQQQLDMAMQNPNDPNSAATVAKMKDIIQHNTTARDNVLLDKKMRNALAKGFNFNYVDPSENKTAEHAAVQEAIKNAKTLQQKREAIQALRQKQNQEAAAAAGKAYAASRPQGLAPNVVAQAKVQAEMAQQKAAEEIYSKVVPEQIRAQSTIEAAQIKQQTELQKEAAEIASRNQQRMQAFNDRVKLMNIADANITRRMYLAANLRIKTDQKILQNRNLDPTQLFKTADASARDWDAQIHSAQARVDAASNELSNLAAYGKGPGDPNYDQAQANLDQATSDLGYVQDQRSQVIHLYNFRLQQEGMPQIPEPLAPITEGGSSNATGSSTKSGSGNNFLDYAPGYSAVP